MQQIELAAFDPKIAEQIADSEPLAVQRNGAVIGYYIPLPPQDTEEMQAAVQRLRAAVQRLLDESGMTEDELADALLIGDHDWQYHTPRD